MNKIYSFFLFFFLVGIVSGQHPSDTLQIMFVGDIMNHGSQIKAAYNPELKTYDYSENFKYVKAIFKKVDFVVGNLETTIGVKPYSGYPQFSAPLALAVACADAGINILATANNHSCDKAKRGIIRTLDILDSLQLFHLGTYRHQVEKDSLTPLIIEKKGFKLALLNYTYGTNGFPIPKPTKVNLIDTIAIKKDIIKSKSLQPDAIIVFLHWGEQYKNKPNQRQKNLVDFFYRQGVNIVIGSHPHVIQPILYERDYINFEDYFTVYSLGNFISNQRRYPRDGSMIVNVKLIKDKNGNLRIAGYQSLPIWVYKYQKDKRLHYEILPVEQFKFNPAYFKQNKDYQKMMHSYRHFQKITGN